LAVNCAVAVSDIRKFGYKFTKRWCVKIVILCDKIAFPREFKPVINMSPGG